MKDQTIEKRIPPKDFQAHPFEYHEEIELEIRGLGSDGQGVGSRDGWVVMVPYTLPKEKVRARVWRNRSSYSDADLVEVICPSPDRVEPKCSIFGTCGGCQYQHLRYEEQLVWKQRQVVDLFRRNSGLTVEVKPIWRSPKEYGYRSKITPHFQRPKKNRPVIIGFQVKGSRKLVDVPHCPIATDKINKALPKERDIICNNKRLSKGGTLLLRDVLEGIVTDNRSVVSQKAGDFIFQLQAGEFFQNNPYLHTELIRYVVDQATDSSVKAIIDTYCGVGVFSISCCRSVERVIGIEISSDSIHWANVNARVNQVENCRFMIGEAERIFQKIDCDPESTCVIIDPPRKGCESSFLNQLAAFSPKRIVYVSCDPATQARDIRTLINENYRITSIQPFDLFPQTRHIECVATLEKMKT